MTAILRREDVCVLKQDGSLVTYDDYEQAYDSTLSFEDSLVQITGRDETGKPTTWAPYLL